MRLLIPVQKRVTTARRSVHEYYRSFIFSVTFNGLYISNIRKYLQNYLHGTCKIIVHENTRHVNELLKVNPPVIEYVQLRPAESRVKTFSKNKVLNYEPLVLVQPKITFQKKVSVFILLCAFCTWMYTTVALYATFR